MKVLKYKKHASLVKIMNKEAVDLIMRYFALLHRINTFQYDIEEERKAGFNKELNDQLLKKTGVRTWMEAYTYAKEECEKYFTKLDKEIKQNYEGLDIGDIYYCFGCVIGDYEFNKDILKNGLDSEPAKGSFISFIENTYKEDDNVISLRE